MTEVCWSEGRTFAFSYSEREQCGFGRGPGRLYRGIQMSAAMVLPEPITRLERREFEFSGLERTVERERFSIRLMAVMTIGKLPTLASPTPDE